MIPTIKKAFAKFSLRSIIILLISIAAFAALYTFVLAPKINKQKDWIKAVDENSYESYKQFLLKHPNSDKTDSAESLLKNRSYIFEFERVFKIKQMIYLGRINRISYLYYGPGSKIVGPSTFCLSDTSSGYSYYLFFVDGFSQIDTSSIVNSNSKMLVSNSIDNGKLKSAGIYSVSGFYLDTIKKSVKPESLFKKQTEIINEIVELNGAKQIIPEHLLIESNVIDYLYQFQKLHGMNWIVSSDYKRKLPKHSDRMFIVDKIILSTIDTSSSNVEGKFIFN